MPCTPDFCDEHDYRVAPGAGWCRAVDTAYLRTVRSPRSGSYDESLAGAIERLGDILERMERRTEPPTARPYSPPPQPKKGGTPLG